MFRRGRGWETAHEIEDDTREEARLREAEQMANDIKQGGVRA
jgi:hypothetical protein